MKNLIGAPINEDKLYCWNQFSGSLKNVQGDYQVMLVDTSKNNLMKERIQKAGFLNAHSWMKKPMDRVVAGRQHLIRAAQFYDYDSILMLDADIIVPKNILGILSKHDKSVVSAIAWTLDDVTNFVTPVPTRIVNGKHEHIDSELLSTGLIEVDGVGFGCLLIKNDVFGLMNIRCERDITGRLTKPEDRCFSEDCKKKGIKLYADTDIQVSHKIAGQWVWEKA